MNGTFDVTSTAGDVYGIVGAGIGLGVLSGMAGMTMRSMRGLYEPGYYEQRPYYGRERTSTYKKKSSRRKTRRRDEYEEERPRDFYSPYGRPMRLNIPRYW